MKGLNFVLAGLGAAVLSVSLANNIYAAGGEPYVSTGVMIDSATSSVYACYAISNADVVSDNMSELESKGYYKISFTSGDGVISDQFDEIYCKDLGKAAELGELYENQFTYAGVYLDGSGERQDFSFYSLPLRVGKSQIPGFSKIDLLEYVKHEYEYGYIDDEENELMNKVINEVVVDGSEYENTGSRASYRDLYGIAPNLQVTLVDLDKYVEVYKSYGVDSDFVEAFLQDLDEMVLEGAEGYRILGHYRIMMLGESDGWVIDKNGDSIFHAGKFLPVRILIPDTMYEGYGDIRAEGFWPLFGDSFDDGLPNPSLAVENRSAPYDAPYDFKDEIVLRRLTTQGVDGGLILGGSYDMDSFGFVLAGTLSDVVPGVPTTGAMKVGDDSRVTITLGVAALCVIGSLVVILTVKKLRQPQIKFDTDDLDY